MPCKKSSKNKRKPNNEDKKERDLIFKEDMQEYAKVEKLLGDKRCQVKLLDGSVKLAKIGGGLKRKRVWINVGNIIIVSFRDFQEDKVDVLYKYNDSEVTKLVQYNEITQSFILSEETEFDDGIIFTNDISDNENEIDINDI